MSIRKAFIASVFVLLLCGSALADSIRIPVPPLPPPPPPPPVPRFETPPPPPAPSAPEVVIVPPPPPFIKIEVGYPDYWFFDDHRGMWFCYEKGHKRRYVKRHVYRDDGRHFNASGKKWVKVDRSHAHKKGWVKHKEKQKVKKKWYRFW